MRRSVAVLFTILFLGDLLFLYKLSNRPVVPAFRTSSSHLHASKLGSLALGVSLLLALVSVAARRRRRSAARSEFPFFNHKGPVYLDSAATTQKPKIVVDAISDFYFRHSANVHRSGHSLGDAATSAYEESRKKLGKFFGTSENNVVITRGATASLNDLARAFERVVHPGDKIVISEAAHSSNFLPWSALAKKTSADLVVLPALASECEILAMIDSRVKLVAVPHVSHVFGSEFPINQISHKLKQVAPEAFLVVDGCQAAGHLIPWASDAVDAYVVSGHKMCGPTGVGATYISDRLKKAIGNFSLGGGTVDSFDKHGNFILSSFPYAFEAGTPPIAEAVGLGVAGEFLRGRRAEVTAREESLRQYLEQQVREIEGVELLSDEFQRVIPLVSLKFTDVNVADVAALISDRVCVRTGVHCAAPLHAAVGANAGSLRLSLGFYNSRAEVSLAVDAIRCALAILRNV